MPTVRAIFVGGPRDGVVETVDARRDVLEAVRRRDLPTANLGEPSSWATAEIETVSYRRTTLVDTDRAEVAVYVADGHAPEELTVAGLAQDRDDLRRQVSELEIAMRLETRGRRLAEAAVEELAADLEDAREELTVLRAHHRTSGDT